MFECQGVVMKNVSIFFLLLFFASSLPAVVQAPNSQCSDQFIGKVAAIIEPAVDSAFAVNKVAFTNVETLEGDLGETVFVDILAGVLKPKVGEVFKLSLRKGVLCQIDKLGLH